MMDITNKLPNSRKVSKLAIIISLSMGSVLGCSSEEARFDTKVSEISPYPCGNKDESNCYKLSLSNGIINEEITFKSKDSFWKTVKKGYCFEYFRWISKPVLCGHNHYDSIISYRGNKNGNND